ncbi:MAG: ABC transporter substrate-binding protein [Solirubrobacteraceae bacterium]
MRGCLAATAFAVTAVAFALGASPSGAARSAEVVRLPLPRYDGTLTPYTFEQAYPLVTLVYDTLMWRDADGVPQPWLARSVTRSEDGQRVTIRLREGVRWHDGLPLTADDVAFTFRFMASRFQPSFTPQLSNVEQVRAVSSDVVAFDLRRPSLGFDDQPLSDVPILPRHLWEGLEGTEAVPPGLPVGSGPYRLVQAGASDGYDFSANEQYFLGRPRVSRIRVPIIRDEEETYRALERREVDMLPFPLNEGTADDLGEGSSIAVKRGPNFIGTALVLNVRRPPFDRLPVRRAVAQALDLSRVLRNTGPGVPADRGNLHPDSRWAPDAILHGEDVSAAQRAFESLGLPPIEVLAPDNDGVRLEAGRQVMLALQRAGTRAILRELPSARLDEIITGSGADPDFQAAIVSTPALSSYDPDFLVSEFGSGVAPFNFSGYRSAAFDALAEQVAAAPDPEARRLAVAEELRQLEADVPVIPLFFSDAAFAYRQAVYDGWVFIEGTGILDKRSFLAGQSRPAAGGAFQAPDATGSDAAANAIRRGALAVLVIAAALAAVGIVVRLRAREK